MLAQVSQQLATLAAAMNNENGDPSPFAAPEKRKPGRPPVAKAEEKKPVQFTAAEIEKIKFLMDTGTEKQEAMRKVFNLRGGAAKAPAKAAAKPTVKVAPKRVAIKMITKEDVENDSYTLAQFRAHLKENGIEKGTENYTTLNNKFLELRAKFKAEIEEENSVAEPEMTDDEQLMGEFEMAGGDDGGFDFSEE